MKNSFSLDNLFFKAPEFFLKVLFYYFRTKVEGAKHLPKKGPCICIANHSGYSGFDALVLIYVIHKYTGRFPRVLAHKFWFITSLTAKPLKKWGFVKATKKNGLRLLKQNQIILIFPEGEYGNFKPTTKAYELQEFKRGFIRMALQAQAPIVPIAVIGAEESHINLHQIQLPTPFKEILLPLPLNLIPLPAKWKIKILKPIELPYSPEAANSTEIVHELAQDIQEKLQNVLNKEVNKRKFVYL